MKLLSTSQYIVEVDMKLIFLDIDGVFNYWRCESRAPSGCLGIDEEKVKLLRQIIDQTGAIVVLTSTWKIDWYRTECIEDLPKNGQYLVNQLSKYKIPIYDKTKGTNWAKRGQGILDFIEELNYSVEQFVIIDDESFDFLELGLEHRFVKTSFEDGLLPEHVDKAVNILNGR